MELITLIGELLSCLQKNLVAPYCATPRDYLSDTPPIAGYGGFVGVSTWRIGCDAPSPFPESFPLGEHAKCKWARYPLCDTISKRYCAIWGGISHWAQSYTKTWQNRVTSIRFRSLQMTQIWLKIAVPRLKK